MQFTRCSAVQRTESVPYHHEPHLNSALLNKRQAYRLLHTLPLVRPCCVFSTGPSTAAVPLHLPSLQLVLCGSFVISSLTEVVPLSTFRSSFRPQAPVFCFTMSSTGPLVPTPGPKRPFVPHGVGLLSTSYFLSSSSLSPVTASQQHSFLLGMRCPHNARGHESRCCFYPYSLSWGMPHSLPKLRKAYAFIARHT